MLYLTLDLELHDPIKTLNERKKEKFIFEQEIILKKIFSLLNENNLKISCFITNDFVKNFYDFFHKYVVEKHEIGCHTSDHLFYNGCNIYEFIQNIKNNKMYLEKEIGLKCKGFRAPGGIVPNNLISILKRFDFKYDSSIIPGIMPGRFNYSNAPKEPYFPDFENIFISNTHNKDIIEFPLLTSKILKISMNGTFFSYYHKFIDLKRYEKIYGVLYFHSSDFKKFNLFEKSFIWDKVRNVKSYWEFINLYTHLNKNTDKRIGNVLTIKSSIIT